MRIAIDCRAFQVFSRYLGIGTYTRHLIQALMEVDSRHEWIPFACADLANGNPAGFLFEGFGNRPGFFIHGKRSLLHQLAAHQVDLCHILEFIPPFSATDRTVATVYDLIPLLFPEAYMAWYHPRSSRNLRAYYRFLSQVPRIIAISHRTREDLIRLLRIPSDRITVIYPGVSTAFRPLSDPRQVAQVTRRYGMHRPFALHVGSCDYRKNIPGLLRAFAKFRQLGFDEFELVLTGKVTQTHRVSLLRMAAALKLTSHLRPLGYIPLEDLVGIYNAAAFLVSPSLYEGFGFPALEAMACGTPVITSNNSSLKEISGGCAWLLEPGDPDSLAEAMGRMAEDRHLRETLSQRGLAHARQFRWERSVGEILRLYENTCP